MPSFSFKPHAFDSPVSIKDFPQANDAKFFVPDMIKKAYSDLAIENQEKEAKILDEVNKRLAVEVKLIQEAAYKDGFEQGKTDSFQAQEEIRMKTIELHQKDLEEVLQTLNDQKKFLISQNMNFFFELIGEICKKVISKYIEIDKEALGKWLVGICDELSQSEELTIHTEEKRNTLLLESMNYLKQHRSKFPNLNFVIDQEKDQMIVESKKVDIVINFQKQIDDIVKLIEYK